MTIMFQWPERPPHADYDQICRVPGRDIRLRIVARHLLISTVLATFMLAVVGCEQTGSSVDQIGSTKTKLPDDQGNSGHETDSNKPSGGEEEDARKLVVGDKAPDFEVEVLGGESLRLSSYFGDASGPTVLLFNRAHW